MVQRSEQLVHLSPQLALHVSAVGGLADTRQSTQPLRCSVSCSCSVLVHLSSKPLTHVWNRQAASPCVLTKVCTCTTLLLVAHLARLAVKSQACIQVCT